MNDILERKSELNTIIQDIYFQELRTRITVNFNEIVDQLSIDRIDELESLGLNESNIELYNLWNEINLNATRMRDEYLNDIQTHSDMLNITINKFISVYKQEREYSSGIQFLNISTIIFPISLIPIGVDEPKGRNKKKSREHTRMSIIILLFGVLIWLIGLVIILI